MLSTIGVAFIVWAFMGLMWWPWGALGAAAVAFDLYDFLLEQFA